MQHFNRERVPERVVHAKGSGAQRRKPDAASPPRWSAIPGLGRPPLGHPPRGEPLPDRIEDRLAEFTALIAAAVSNTASRDEVARLADEQAALRRVATLVARQSSPAEVFGAVADEVARILGTDAVGSYATSTTEPSSAWSRRSSP